MSVEDASDRPGKRDPRIRSSFRKKTANEALLDSVIIHAHGTERYTAQQVNALVELLADAAPEIQRRLISAIASVEASGGSVLAVDRLTTQLEDVSGILNILSDRLAGKQIAIQTEAAQFEANWWKRAAEGAIPEGLTGAVFDVRIPGSSALRQIAESQAFGQRDVRNAYAQISREALAVAESRIKRGFLLGDSTDQIAQSVLDDAGGMIGLIDRHTRTLARTGLNGVYNSVASATAAENSDLIKGERVVATLDARTTLLCMSRDGDIYPIGVGRRPPFHYNCRTRMSWVLRSWQELGIDLPENDDVAANVRSSLTGEVPASKKYPDWLRDITPKQQDVALGPQLAARFRAGELDFAGFRDLSFATPNGGFSRN